MVRSIEGARAIELGRAEPKPLGAWPHDRRVGLVPLALEELHDCEWLTDVLLEDDIRSRRSSGAAIYSF
jgi:hypothetical protein